MTPSGSRRTTPAPSISCPSRNTVAVTSTASPTVALAGRRPQSTIGCTSNMGIRPITKETYPAGANHMHDGPTITALSWPVTGPAAGRCDQGHEKAYGLVVLVAWSRIRVTQRESNPPVHHPPRAAARAGAAALADAQPAL